MIARLWDFVLGLFAIIGVLLSAAAVIILIRVLTI